MSTEGSGASRTTILVPVGSGRASEIAVWLESLSGGSGVHRLSNAIGVCILEVRFDDEGRLKSRAFSAEEQSKEVRRMDEFDRTADLSASRNRVRS